jgi:hypothetical protein
VKVQPLLVRDVLLLGLSKLYALEHHLDGLQLALQLLALRRAQLQLGRGGGLARCWQREEELASLLVVGAETVRLARLEGLQVLVGRLCAVHVHPSKHYVLRVVEDAQRVRRLRPASKKKRNEWLVTFRFEAKKGLRAVSQSTCRRDSW